MRRHVKRIIRPRLANFQNPNVFYQSTVFSEIVFHFFLTKLNCNEYFSESAETTL